MTSWGVRSLTRIGIGLIGALALVGDISGQPVPIAPPPEVPAAPTEPAADLGARIDVNPLSAPDPSSVGTLYDGDGGLGVEMWRGSRRELVERLIPLLPAPSESPVAQALTRRLLLTAAAVPAGQAGAKSLVHLRLERLAALGASEAAVALARLAPPALQDAALARLEIDARWAMGDDIEACLLARRQLRRDDNPYWLKASLVCHARAGDQQQIALSLSLARDQGIDDGPFFALAEALLGAELKLGAAARLEPLHMALARQFKQYPAGDAATAANAPAVLAALARSPGGAAALAGTSGAPQVRDALGAPGDAAAHLIAAERAEALGALSPAELAKIYSEARFTDQERQGMLSAEVSARANALYYQVALAQPVPLARAEALRRAWVSGRERGFFGTAARANLAAARQLTPAPELSFIATAAIRALLTAGDADAARPWHAHLTARPAGLDAQIDAAAAEVWPLMTVAGQTGPWDNAAFRRWLAIASRGDGAQPAAKAALLLALAEALGQTIPRETWDEFYGVAPVGEDQPPAAGVLRGLREAAAGKRKGETVLFALIALGPRGPARATAATLAAVIEGLGAVGLAAEARQVALEAMLARGL
jgi:hypothetical protein